MNGVVEVFRILADWIQQHLKRIIYPDQVDLILECKGWFNIWKSMYCTKLTEWRAKIPKKAFDKIQYPFIIKTLISKNRRKQPQYTKDQIWKALANDTQWWKIESFPWKNKKRRMSTFTSTIQHGSKSPSQTGKEEVKFSVDSLNLYVENPNDPPKKMLEVMIQQSYRI